MFGTQRIPRRLSVALIVRDAEQILLSTLESVQDLADEIIIVDTGSKDRTRELARRRATRMVEISWCDSFAVVRNAALDECTGDWILWLDAGETIAPSMAKELRQFIDLQAKPDTAYLLMVSIPGAQTDSQGEQAARLRLLPARDDLRYFGHVREQLRYDQALGELKVEQAPGTIKRGLREQDPQVRQQRAERNLALALGDEREFGASARACLVQGEAWQELGDPTAAVAAFRRAIEMAEPRSTEMLDAYYGWLTAFDAWPERREEQIAIAAVALDSFPLDAQLLCAVGNYLLQSGRIDLAARSFQMATEHGQINIETWHLPNIAEIAASCWSMALEQLGQLPQAMDILEQLITQDQPSPRLLRQLLEQYIARDMRQPALDLVRRLPISIGERENMRTVVRGACQVLQGNSIGGHKALAAAYASGCRDPLCYRWLCTALIQLGLQQEAEPLLAEWRQLEPRRAELRHLELLAAQNIPQTAPTATQGQRNVRMDNNPTRMMPTPLLSSLEPQIIRQ